MQKTILTKKLDKDAPLHKKIMDFQFAKDLVTHLHKIGQIKEMPTEEQMIEYWNQKVSKI